MSQNNAMLRALSILTLAAVVAAGCKSIQHVKLTRPTFIKSVVSLSPSTTEIVATDAAQTLLRGRTAADDYPMSVPKSPAEIVASVKPDYQKITEIHPELIVYDSALYGPSDAEKIKALGFETVVIDADTVDGFETELWKMGDLLGYGTQFADYIDRIRDEANKALAEKITPVPKVAMILAGNGGSPMIAGTKSFEADVIRIAGGDPVGPPVNNFVPASPETLATLDPDIIVLPTSEAHKNTDAASLLNSPTLQGLKAIKKKSIAPIDEEVAERRGARVDLFIKSLHNVLGAMGGK